MTQRFLVAKRVMSTKSVLGLPTPTSETLSLKSPATITRDSFSILGSFDTTPSLLSEIRPELQYCCRKIDIIVCSRRNALFIGFGRVVLRKLGLAIIQ
jgi:hypothetical protein